MNAPALLAEAHQRHRLRASDFEILHEAGALQDVRKAELIDGDIYTMSPQTTWHARVKSRLGFLLQQRLESIRNDLEVVVEVSVIVAEDSVPEPDIVISGYKGSGFMPGDTVSLAVEISNTTLGTDLGRKAVLYAAAEIPEYWVIDLDSRRVFIHTRPSQAGFQTRREVAFGEELVCSAIEGLRIGTAFLVD